jgi:hypothetical protein
LRHNLKVSFERAAPALGRWVRYIAFLILVPLFAGLLSAPTTAKTKPSASSTTSSDRGYASSLAAANRFLQAWQNQDHETGLLMLSDGAKQHISEEQLESFFASGPDAAYEIVHGTKLKAGRYAFPVTLFAGYSGLDRKERPRKSQIVVALAGKDEWTIDRLP